MSASEYIGLGANLGDRIAMLRRAAEALREITGTVDWRFSPIYESVAQDADGRPFANAPAYVNAVAACAFAGNARHLLRELLAIERTLGRTRTGAPAEPRVIDLDLLDVDGQTCALSADDGSGLPAIELPHPRLERRAFVLAPLADLAPGWRSTAGTPIAALLAALDTTAELVPMIGVRLD